MTVKYSKLSEVSNSKTALILRVSFLFRYQGLVMMCRLRLKCDGTRAETRFRLSAKRTSPFKSVGGRQFSRLMAAEVCASAVVMLDTPCSEVVWECWQPTPFTSFPFTSPPVRHRVPSHFNWTLLSEVLWFPLQFPHLHSFRASCYSSCMTTRPGLDQAVTVGHVTAVARVRFKAGRGYKAARQVVSGRRSVVPLS